VIRLYEHHTKRKTQPTLEEIFAALQAVYATYTAVYIVVDALDEGSDLNGERSRLLVELRALQERPGERLMATSRFMSDIAQEFRSMSVL